MNTYGLFSVNERTFNRSHMDDLDFPVETRNTIVTALRIHNGVLNILGYIPVISIASGCVRIGSGAAIIATTLAIGDRNAEEGAVIGRWYDEALRTGIAQIVRGVFESMVPFGQVVNLLADIVATPFNFGAGIEDISMKCDCTTPPYPDPHYSFQLLYFV